MTMAKGVLGAYAPLGATIVTLEITARFEDEMFCCSVTVTPTRATLSPARPSCTWVDVSGVG